MNGTARMGSFYAVEPGPDDTGPEYFPDTLAGLTGKDGAMVRAIGLSAGGRTQQVSKTAGRTTRLLREYRDGKETYRSGAGLIPPPSARTAPVPAGASASIRPMTRRRRKPDPVTPPCEGAS